MTREMIIKAWKSEQYRHTLSAMDQAQLPAHPAGVIQLEDAALGGVSGGTEGETLSLGCIISILAGTCSPGGTFGCCGPRPGQKTWTKAVETEA